MWAHPAPFPDPPRYHILTLHSYPFNTMKRFLTLSFAPLFFAALMLVSGLSLTATAAGPEPEATVHADPTEVVIQPKGNQMLYEQTEFTVSAGDSVTVVFENTATSPAMQHNVVVLNTDDKSVANRVGQAALSASGSEYVPDDDAILAATSLAQPGDTVEVTFTAPEEPGEYLYICTFPGHYAMMRGTMVVE